MTAYLVRLPRKTKKRIKKLYALINDCPADSVTLANVKRVVQSVARRSKWTIDRNGSLL